MAKRKPVETRVAVLEKTVKKNTREIKRLEKRITALENAYSKELANVHGELVDAMFEAFGFVPPSQIGSAYDEIMKKKAEAKEEVK